jgi:hypothetical protein
MAVHWWLPFAAALVGVFLLLRTLTIDPWLSGALAVVATMTPYNAWWSAPPPALVLGYGALAGACVIAALKATRRMASVGLGAAAGVAGTAMFHTLYPPWVISVALVVVAVVLGYAADLRPGWSRLGLTLAGLVAVAMPAIIGWYLTNSAAIHAIAATFYPRQRLAASGGATLAWLLDAPLNPLLTGPVGGTLDGRISGNPYTNLSETSASWLPLPILAAAVAVAAVRWRRPPKAGVPPVRGSQPGVWTVAALASVLGLLLAWGVLRLPGWAGSLLLERVQGTRLPLALGLGSVLLVAVVGSARRGARHPAWEQVFWLGAIAGTVALTMWSAAQMPWDHAQVSTKTVLVFGLVVAVGFGLIASGQLARSAATGLAVFATWSWALVNPLYHGLGPLDHDPVVRALRPVAEADPGVRVEVFGDLRLVALVRSTGLQSLSGITFYPNERLMEHFVTNDRRLWNNYAIYRWVAEPTARTAFIRQIKGTSMELHVNPCAPELLHLGGSWAVSDERLDVACLQPVDTIRSASGPVYRYRVIR